MKLQSEITRRAEELSTGKHSDLGLELGSRAGFLVSLHHESDALQALIDTNKVVGARLGATQSKLDSIQSGTEDLLNALLASSSSDAHAGTIQAAAKSRRSGLISDLDSTLGGNFLFAGTNTGTKPIVDYDAVSSPAKLAVDAAFLATFGISQSNPDVSEISGSEMQAFLDTEFAVLFEDPSWGETWSSAADQELTDRISPTRMEKTSVTANEAPFRQLAQAYSMLVDLGTQNLGPDAYNAVASTAGALLRSAIGGLTELRASVGAVQSEIASATEGMSVQISLLATQVGNLENVDTYEVSSRLTELQTQLEASYFVTAQLRDLSLVHYL